MKPCTSTVAEHATEMLNAEIPSSFTFQAQLCKHMRACSQWVDLGSC